MDSSRYSEEDLKRGCTKYGCPILGSPNYDIDMFMHRFDGCFKCMSESEYLGCTCPDDLYRAQQRGIARMERFARLN